MAPSPRPICGEPLDYPQPLCTRDPGHDGSHATEMIPEPLSGVVADTLRVHDELERERVAVSALGDRLRARLRTVRYIAVVLIVVATLNGAGVLWNLFQ